MKRRGWIVLMVLIILPLALTGIGCKKKTPPPAKFDAPVADKAPVQRDTSANDMQEQAIAAARARFLNDHIYFDFDKSDITAEAQVTLKAKAEWLKSNPNASIVIEGHCDERGTNEYNLALGDRRARAAKMFLGDLGIDASQMDTTSYGEEMPLDPGQNEAAWAKNRRAQFVIK